MKFKMSFVGLLLTGFVLSVTGAFAQNLDIEVMGPGLHKMEVTHSDGMLQRYIIDIPEGYDGSKPVPMILGLHYGFDGVDGGDRPEPYWSEGLFTKIYQQAYKPLGAIFLAPDSINGSWTTPENEAAVLSLMDGVIAAYNIDASKTIVTGYSMGGIGTWNWAAKFQERFAGAIPIAGIPVDLKASVDLNAPIEEMVMLNVDWKIPLYVIHSHADEVIDIAPTMEYVNKLKADGKDVTFQELTVITHYQFKLLPESIGKTVPWIKKVWENDG